MYQRKESNKRVVLADGTAVNVRILDGIMIEDLLIQASQATAWKLMTGTDLGPNFKRDVKDYLIRLYTIS